MKKFVLFSILMAANMFAATHYLENDCYGAISKDALTQLEKADANLIQKLIAENKVVKLKAGIKVDIVDSSFIEYMKKVSVDGQEFWIKDVEGQIKKLD